MAAKIDPDHVRARHQSMHHFVAHSPWDGEALLRVASDYALAQLERHAPVSAWVVDDTSIPKQGRHSVGVARQYCGALGKRANCQVAVSVSLVNEMLSVPCAYRLYLPEEWAEDRERRAAVGVPEHVVFRTKWQIAVDSIDRLRAEDLPLAPVVADAGYGNTTELREALTTRGLVYAVAVGEETSVWPPGQKPLPPAPWTGRRTRPTRLRRTPEHQPVSVGELAANLLDSQRYDTVRWREGTRGRMASRFAAVRVRPAHRDTERSTPRPDRMAPDRMATRRQQALALLAVDGLGARDARRSGAARPGALAHRTRLPGAQRRDRSRPLRGPRMEGLPPSRRLMHRRLRLPRSRASSAFPPTACFLPRRRFPTRRLPAPGSRPGVLSATTRPPSPPCTGSAPALSSGHCPTVPPVAVDGIHIYDTVVLARWWRKTPNTRRRISIRATGSEKTCSKRCFARLQLDGLRGSSAPENSAWQTQGLDHGKGLPSLSLATHSRSTSASSAPAVRYAESCRYLRMCRKPLGLYGSPRRLSRRHSVYAPTSKCPGRDERG